MPSLTREEIVRDNGETNVAPQPFRFKVACGQVVKGWDAAVTQLSVGEKATCVFPARLAYGEKGFPGLIPKNAELHVTLELVAISMGD